MPSEFAQPTSITGDPAGPGVYFMAWSPSDARVFHWDGEKLTSWSVGDPAKNHELLTGIQYAVAADSGDVVWVGINSTLIRLDATTGQTTTTTIPAASNSAAADAIRPSELHGYHPITAMSVSADRHLAIAREGATDIEIRNPDTGTFDRVLAAPTSQPISVAYDEQGRLAIGSNTIENGHGYLGQGTLQIVEAGTTTVTSSRPTPGGNLLPRPGGGFVLIPSSAATFSAVAIAPDGTQTPTKPIASKTQLAVEGPSALITADTAAAGSVTGWAVFNTSDGTEQDVEFPPYDCRGKAIPGTIGPAPTEQPTCFQRATALVSDHSGTIWAFTSGPGNQIAHMTS